MTPGGVTGRLRQGSHQTDEETQDTKIA